jgi:Ca2+ transporting ATPase
MEGKDFRSTVGVLKRIPVDPSEPPSENRKMMNVVGNQGVFNRVIKHLKVLARSSPEDKLLLVTGL